LNRVDSAGRKNPAKDSPEGRLTILAIDDHREVISGFEEWLTAQGCRVFTALTGEQGLRILQQHKVEVVICDLNMPGMNGWEVCRAIQNDFRKTDQQAPVFILVTGSTGHLSENIRTAESGIAAIVKKPVNLTSLLEVINEAIGKP
jgi:CheY-like chemotaxis protein